MSRAAITNIDPICVECGKLADLVTGAEVYPHRPDLHHKPFWRCTCGAYVGCHPDTDIPLGYPAGPITRRARSDAHAAFDPLWEAKQRRDKVSKGKAREAGYSWLAEQLGIRRQDCHVSHFDAATARRVVEICKAIHEKAAAK